MAILGIVAHAPRIQQLSVAGCIELTDNALLAICALGRHLRVVDVGGLDHLTDKGVFAMASACRRLQSVDVSELFNALFLPYESSAWEEGGYRD